MAQVSIDSTVSRTLPRSHSKATLWTARVMQGIAVLFLAFDSVMKFFPVPEVVDGTKVLGFQEHHILPIGVLSLTCLVLYLIPRTAVLGAVLWTGYLGGAIATHVRLDNPLFTHVLFPIYVAVLIWGSLWLRDDRIRQLMPFRTKGA